MPQTELDNKFLLSLSDHLSSSEVQRLIFLCKGIVLSKEVADEIKSFPDLVKALEKKNSKITTDIRDYQVLFDILELIKRRDIIKKIKHHVKKLSEGGRNTRNPRITTGVSLDMVPFFSPNGTNTQETTEISEKSVVLKEMLQKGEYSDFWKGQSKGKDDVIVEVYKVSRSSDMQQSFATQGDIQCRLKHSNIVEVLKVFRNKEPPWIVLEWMTNGDFRTFLRRTQNLSSAELIGFAAQIAEGMSFIQEKRYVHCNLKACNIFVANNNRMKIGGFCLARKLGIGDFFELEEDVRLSMRWSAVDVIKYRQVSDKSDVWSFGIVLVEMFSKGEVPYADMETKEIVNQLRQGYRHPKPDLCPNGLYHIMKCCWNVPDDFRPSFKDLLHPLSNYREGDDYSSNPKLKVVMETRSSGNSRSQLMIDRASGSDSNVEKRSSYLRYMRLIEESSNYLEGTVQMRDKRGSLFPGSWSDWNQVLELPRDSIQLLKQIGSGEFGEVWKAKLPNEKEVAVKMFLPTRMEPKQFLEEAEMLKKFDHPNILTLVGVCSEGFPIYIVTELMPLGSLLENLRLDGGQTILRQHLLQYALQVADAMTNVEALNCIHRDIAARNVFMRDRRTVKLGDFGLSRTAIFSYYQVNRELRIPARWTAPEAAKSQKFSIKSDVWSFGVLLVELVTYGETPYPDMNSTEVIASVSKGYKHPQPVSNCPDDIYEVMISCWRIKPENRPSFKELLVTIKQLLDVYEKKTDSASQ